MDMEDDMDETGSMEDVVEAVNDSIDDDDDHLDGVNGMEDNGDAGNMVDFVEAADPMDDAPEEEPPPLEVPVIPVRRYPARTRRKPDWYVPVW